MAARTSGISIGLQHRSALFKSAGSGGGGNVSVSRAKLVCEDEDFITLPETNHRETGGPLPR